MRATEIIASLGDGAFDLCGCGAWRFLHAAGTGACLVCEMRGYPGSEDGCQAFELATPAAEVPRSQLQGLVMALLYQMSQEMAAAFVALALAEKGDPA